MWKSMILLTIVSLNYANAYHNINKDTDCYPFVYNKPNVSEDLCLAQGCKWNGNNKPFCTFNQRKVKDSQCFQSSLASRIACRNPFYFNSFNINEDLCTRMGCCYQETMVKGVPSCFHTQENGYRLENLRETNFGWEGDIYQLESYIGPFLNDIKHLKLKVFLETEHRVRIKIIDPNFPRYEVEDVIASKNIKHSKKFLRKHQIKFNNNPFGVAVIRKSTKEVLFNSTPPMHLTKKRPFGGIIYENQYLEISTSIDASFGGIPSIFGLGEQVAPLKLLTVGELGQHYTFFSRDHVVQAAQHTAFGGENLYGVHPMYMLLYPSGNTHGVFFLNSNAMEVLLQENALTYRTIGGILDIFIFSGTSPSEVVSQYTELIGRPQLPPYWSLGFHLCRWGYETINHTKELVEKMREKEIPHDVQWNDIDYMDRFLDFTLDPKRYPKKEVQTFVTNLHEHGQRYVVIVDPGISPIYNDYSTYREGKDLDIFIKDGLGNDINGKVWPGTVVFPDFTHPNILKFWTNQLNKLYNLLSFDGIWVDMNEPANFCYGRCHKISSKFQYSNDTKSPFDPFRQPFVPGQIQQNFGQKGDLDIDTISMAALQYRSLHYNVHSLYGHTEMKITSEALKNLHDKKRSFILSRSTFAGSGRYGAHWLGDNNSSWINMKDSISGILAMNIFGIPFVGADICGFGGNTTKELCIRWQQLGSFYPFSRNHNMGKLAQSPVDFDDETSDIIRKSLNERYRLLPYFYTLFFDAHIKGLTVARHLFFEFPKDIHVLNIDSQFLLGKGLMITPVLTKGDRQVKAYFPDDAWYDYWTGKAINNNNIIPGYVLLNAPLDHINLHIRGGTIIPMQSPALTTKASKKTNFSLLIALSLKDKEESYGKLFIDDGESSDTISFKKYTLIKFYANMEGNELFIRSVLSVNGFNDKIPILDKIRIVGIQKNLDIKEIKFQSLSANIHRSIEVYYDSKYKTLSLNNLSLSLNQEFIISSYQSLHYSLKSRSKLIYFLFLGTCLIFSSVCFLLTKFPTFYLLWSRKGNYESIPDKALNA